MSNHDKLTDINHRETQTGAQSPKLDSRGADKKPVAIRLRSARESLGLTQKEAAQRAKMPLPSYKDYEAGNRIPGGEALELLLLAGININWLLTGTGPMLMADLLPTTVASTLAKPDWNTLTSVIAAIEQRLHILNIALPADKKAQLIGLVYDLCGTEKNDPATLDRFIKLVSD